MQKLDLRARRFVDAFLGSANGNGTEACRQAGYAGKPAVLAVQASRLLRRANVRQAIDARLRRREKRSILDADARDQLLSEFAEMTELEVRDRIRAIAELNKCTGRHSIKHLHSGKLTLEQVLGESRMPPGFDPTARTAVPGR